jgi:hypothetical protein
MNLPGHLPPTLCMPSRRHATGNHRGSTPAAQGLVPEVGLAEAHVRWHIAAGHQQDLPLGNGRFVSASRAPYAFVLVLGQTRPVWMGVGVGVGVGVGFGLQRNAGRRGPTVVVGGSHAREPGEMGERGEMAHAATSARLSSTHRFLPRGRQSPAASRQPPVSSRPSGHGGNSALQPYMHLPLAKIVDGLTQQGSPCLLRLAADSSLRYGASVLGPCALEPCCRNRSSIESTGGSLRTLAGLRRTLCLLHLFHPPSPCTVAVLLASPPQLPRTLTASCRHGTVLGLLYL